MDFTIFRPSWAGMVSPGRIAGFLVVTSVIHCNKALCDEDICDDEDYNSLLQSRTGKRERARSISLGDAAEIARELANKMTFSEKSQIVKGTAYSLNEYNPPTGYFVGNTAAVPRLGIPSLNLQDSLKRSEER
eukprot:Skav221933  [mRNA]  locus=scaffold195:303532:307336:+ [translate_table: standard]